MDTVYEEEYYKEIDIQIKYWKAKRNRKSFTIPRHFNLAFIVLFIASLNGTYLTNLSLSLFGGA